MAHSDHATYLDTYRLDWSLGFILSPIERVDGRPLVQVHMALLPYSVLPFASIHLSHTLGLRTPLSPMMSRYPASCLYRARPRGISPDSRT